MMKAWWFFFMTVCTLGHASSLLSFSAKNTSNEAARVQFTCSGACRYHLFTLTKPERVVLDLTDTTHRLSIANSLKGDGFIQHIRVGQPSPHTLRLVFDVRSPARTTGTPNSGSATSLNVVLSARSGAAAPTLPIKTTGSRVEKAPAAPPPRAVHVDASRRSLRDIVIVLDPGHGGHDPGAIGPGRKQEKHVVLAIAMHLKQLIDRQPGMHAVLTRKGDYYVGLRERLMIARKYNADVFISIHADAFINTHSHGASVFALSTRGASSEAARWLAEKENYSELGGVNLKGLDDQSGLIRTVLLDLSQTATITASLQLGSEVLQDLGRMTTLHNRHVEQARFVVLKSPDTPSVLVETGFISNPSEAQNLADAHYQARLASAIVTGLKRYFWAYPPHGSRLEALVNKNGSVIGLNDLNQTSGAVA